MARTSSSPAREEAGEEALLQEDRAAHGFSERLSLLPARPGFASVQHPAEEEALEVKGDLPPVASWHLEVDEERQALVGGEPEDEATSIRPAAPVGGLEEGQGPDEEAVVSPEWRGKDSRSKMV